MVTIFLFLLSYVFISGLCDYVDVFDASEEEFIRREQTSQNRRESLTVRKEIRSMSSTELDEYFDALKAYKSTGRLDGLTYMDNYDTAIAQHALATSNTTIDQAHAFAAFLIWHGVYVREIELALQSINPNVYIPFWDWTLDSTRPANLSVIFTSDYFGSSSSVSPYEVIDGRMAYWEVSSDSLNYVWWESPSGYFRGPNNSNPSPYVSRGVGIGARNSYPTKFECDVCLNKTAFNKFWECLWGTVGKSTSQSNLHGGVHVLTGGTWSSGSLSISGDMEDLTTSPNDPIWFSHHAALDRLWFNWKANIGDALVTDDDPCGMFYGGNVRNPQPPGHNLKDQFYPPFYLGGDDPLTLAQGCYYLQSSRSGYSYAP